MLQPLISVIIVNYNTCDFLRNCVFSLFSFSGNFEVIVVDNNSVDDSVKMLEMEFGDKVRLIKNQTNPGFGTANNIGARQASGDILFFLNSDTIIKSNIWEGIVDIFSDNKIIVAEPIVLQADNTEQPFSYGNFPTIFSIVFDRKWHKIKLAQGNIDVDWVTGAALLIRRSVFEKINGFDEKFFMYFEDMDLCLRAREFGRVVSARSISLIHFGGASLSDDNRRKELYYFSQGYYFRKHYGGLKTAILMIFRWIYKKIK